MRSGKTMLHRFQTGALALLPLLAVALIAGVSAHSVQLAEQVNRKSAEQHLLFIGGEFERALLAYAGAGGLAGPATLEELLRDTRQPALRRHLRQIYADPLTGKAEWGLLRDTAGRIVGVYSLAAGVPIQQTGFLVNQSHFSEADSYAKWVFGLPSVKPASAGANKTNSQGF